MSNEDRSAPVMDMLEYCHDVKSATIILGSPGNDHESDEGTDEEDESDLNRTEVIRDLARTQVICEADIAMGDGSHMKFTTDNNGELVEVDGQPNDKQIETLASHHEPVESPSLIVKDEPGTSLSDAQGVSDCLKVTPEYIRKLPMFKKFSFKKSIQSVRSSESFVSSDSPVPQGAAPRDWMAKLNPTLSTNNCNVNQSDSSPSNSTDKNGIVSPFGIFNLFFDDTVVRYIVEMTNLYAHREKGITNFSTNVDEIRLFIAILLLSGYSIRPRRKLYWDTSPDIYCPAVANAMKRERFEDIMKYFHLCDNQSIDVNDKMAKVRPLYNMMNERCLMYQTNPVNLCADKVVLPFLGSKQLIHSKRPIYVGYKVWVLAEESGYVVQCNPYQPTEENDPKSSSGSALMLNPDSFKIKEPKNGVLLADRNASQYGICIRSKKWWWTLFTWIPDVIMQNAWLFYRSLKSPEDPTHDLLSFRREVVQVYLTKYKTASNLNSMQRERNRTHVAEVKGSRGRFVPPAVRFDGVGHFSEPSATTKRCARCRKSSRKWCKKCGKGIHDHCFNEFHGFTN